jgi:hypothetical protein
MASRATALQTRAGSTVVRRLQPAARVAITMTVGLALALAMLTAATLVIVLSVVVAHGVLELPSIRARRARRRARVQRQRRHRRRELRLLEARAWATELPELGEIVDEVSNASTGDHGQLEDMLDRYAALALARQRCDNALALGEPHQLEARLAFARLSPGHTARLLELRIAHARKLVGSRQRLEDALREIAELIRYCGDRATEPSLDGLLDDDPVIAMLERCDALDAAEAELAPIGEAAD